MKKLKLEKSTIANLNESSMENIEGGGTAGCSISGCGTQCGPQCDTSAVGCGELTDVACMTLTPDVCPTNQNTVCYCNPTDLC